MVSLGSPKLTHILSLYLPLHKHQRVAMKVASTAQTVRRQEPLDLQRSRCGRGREGNQDRKSRRERLPSGLSQQEGGGSKVHVIHFV